MEQLPRPVQEAALLTGKLARFVLDRLSITAWSEMAGVQQPEEV